MGETARQNALIITSRKPVLLHTKYIHVGTLNVMKEPHLARYQPHGTGIYTSQPETLSNRLVSCFYIPSVRTQTASPNNTVPILLLVVPSKERPPMSNGNVSIQRGVNKKTGSFQNNIDLIFKPVVIAITLQGKNYKNVFCFCNHSSYFSPGTLG